MHHPDLARKQFRRTSYATVPLTLPEGLAKTNVVLTYMCPHMARMASLTEGGLTGGNVPGDGAFAVEEHVLKDMAYISSVCLRMALVVVMSAWCDMQSRETHHTIAYTSIQYGQFDPSSGARSQ